MKHTISMLNGLFAAASLLLACGGTEAVAPAPDAEMCLPGAKGCDDHGEEGHKPHGEEAAKPHGEEGHAHDHGEEGHKPHGEEGAKDDHGDEANKDDHGEEGHKDEGEEGHKDEATKEVTLTAEAMAVSEIRVGKAERRIISGGGAFPAEIAFDPTGTAHVSPIGGGRFARVDVKLGDKVEAGQLLAALVSSDVADLEGQLAQTRARLVGAEAELRRNTQLVKEGVGAERGLVEARAAVGTLRAEAAGIQKRLAVFGPQVGGQVELKAPIAGTIAEIHAVIGESAATDEPAFTITDPSKIFVEAFVPELDVGRVAVDAQVIVRTHAFPDLALSGRITSIAPSLDRATRSLSVRITLDAADARLRGHMFAMVELVGDGGRPIVVPADGVATLEGQDVVFVPGHEALTFVPKPVRLGRRASGFVEILAGLQEGAAVVVHGGFVLKSALSTGSLSEGHVH